MAKTCGSTQEMRRIARIECSRGMRRDFVSHLGAGLAGMTDVRLQNKV